MINNIKAGPINLIMCVIDEKYHLEEDCEMIERVAKVIYEQWSDKPGYRPWHGHGNSLKQDEARELARNALYPDAVNQNVIEHNDTVEELELLADLRKFAETMALIPEFKERATRVINYLDTNAERDVALRVCVGGARAHGWRPSNYKSSDQKSKGSVKVSELKYFSEDDCMLDVDQDAWQQILDSRGGCRCFISPPCCNCTEPITEQELNDVGYTYEKGSVMASGRTERMDELTQRVAKDPKFDFENVCSTIDRASLISELLAEAANLRANAKLFGFAELPPGALVQERAAAMLAADAKDSPVSQDPLAVLIQRDPVQGQ